jgi:hypothetical protein
MSGRAMSPELSLRRKFRKRQVRKEIAMGLIERNDGFTTVLCHEQKSGAE